MTTRLLTCSLGVILGFLLPVVAVLASGLA
jgi:hypothetical protein